jgi:ABC-type branched-subunit amino acid transport system ATPase component
VVDAADPGDVLETGRITAHGRGAELLADGRVQSAHLGA